MQSYLEISSLFGEVHPVRFAGNFNLSFPGRILENGYPGSGNVLLINITNELLKKKKFPNYNYISNLFSEAAINADTMLDIGLRKLFSPVGLHFYNKQIFDYEFSFVTAVSEDGQFLNFKVGTGSVYSANFLSTHEYLDKVKLERFRSMGYLTIISLRHPYDIIISNAAKIFINRKEDVPSLLFNFEWFESLAENIKKYMEAYIELNYDNSVFFFKYENIIQKPISEITRLANILSVEISEEEAATIWEKFGFKTLQRDHLWRPGYGKFQEFLGPKHYEILQQFGFENILNALEYTSPPESAFNKLEEPDKEAIREISSEHVLGIPDLQYYQFYGKRPVITPPFLYTVFEPKMGGEIRSTNQNLLELFQNDHDFQKLLVTLNASWNV